MTDGDLAGGFSRRRFLKAAGVAATASALPSAAWASDVGGRGEDAAVVHGWVRALQVAQRDARALPPAAARLYALAMLAGHEAATASGKGGRSLARGLNGLQRMPRRGGTDGPIAVNAAIQTLAVAASSDRSQQIRDALAAHGAATHEALAQGVRPRRAQRALEQGREIGRLVAEWAATDGYAETRGLPYTPPVGPGLWRPTPPNFGAAIEPYWHRIRPLSLRVQRRDSQVIDPAAPAPPIPYDPTPGSPFHAQAMAVYEASAALTDAQRHVAMHWRDNPDGVTGLPSGHWLRIASDVVADAGLPLQEATRVLAITAICVADAFTSCWIEKYRSNVLRPVTYIRDHIDGSWSSFVNSPAFPEYTSGHSTGSGAAAYALAELLGERAFEDRTVEGLVVEGTYTLGRRAFDSFAAAADEAAASRLYGGIHYPMAIDVGLEQGRTVARQVLSRLT